MNKPTDIQEIWNNWELMYKHPRNISRKFELAYPVLEISTIITILVSKWGNEQPDKTYKKSDYFELVYKHPRNVSRKFEKR